MRPLRLRRDCAHCIAGATLMSALGACGASRTPTGTTAASAGARRIVVSLVSGTISRHRPDGQPWHVTTPDPVLPILGGLLAASFGLPPRVGESAGRVMAGEPHEIPPSTFVRVQYAGTLFESHRVPRSLSPVWHYRVAIDTRTIAPATPITFSVINGEEEESLGRFTTTLGALENSSGMMLENSGAIESLQIGVEQLREPPVRETYRFHIPATASMEQLAADVEHRPRAPGDWQGIRVLNGDRVHVRATGSVQPSCGFFGSPSVVVSPEGIRNRWDGYTLEPFRGLPHAAVVALCAGTPQFVGSEREFTIERPGMLLLLVNDSDPGNNCGAGFDVDVTVN